MRDVRVKEKERRGLGPTLCVLLVDEEEMSKFGMSPECRS